jgi:hypothetical protein
LVCVVTDGGDLSSTRGNTTNRKILKAYSEIRKLGNHKDGHHI